MQGHTAQSHAVQQRFVVAAGVLASAAALISLRFLPNAFASNYLPHKFCLMAQPTLIWLHSISDTLIGTSYFVISALLAWLVYHYREDVPFSWMFLAFGIFIIACGAGHFLDVLVLWKPLYWLVGYEKVATAIASVATAGALPFLLPRIGQFIRERKELVEMKERRAEASERRFQLAQQAARVAAWEWDVRTGEVSWSAGSEMVYGRSPQEMSSYEAWDAALHPEDRARVLEYLQQALRGELDHYDQEYRVLDSSGATRWIASRGRVFFDEAGKAVRMIGIDQDVSSRKQAEDVLRRMERSAATGRLAAVMAHEINNPLESVSNLLFLLSRERSPSPEMKTYIEMARKELERIVHITKHTLSFHREAKQPVAVQVADVVENVAVLYNKQLAAKMIELEIDIKYQGVVEGFPGELRQVLSNLVANAIDAMGERGRLRIATEQWERGTRIIVQDTGRGIPEDVRRHIFEPFFTTKGEKGTGLGLWVTDEMVRRHGGLIRVESSTGEQDHGTTFVIELPAVHPKRLMQAIAPVEMSAD